MRHVRRTPGMEIARNIPLVVAFMQRELKSRYRTTVLGWLWSLAIPLATLAIYAVVFTVVFRSQPPAFGNGRVGSYAAWLFVGLVVWAAMSNTVTSAIATLLDVGPLMQKVRIPAYAPVLGAALAMGVQVLIEAGIALAAMLAFGNVGPTWLLLAPILVLLMAFSASLGLTLAVVNIYARDVKQITTVALQLVFFLSPVLYPVSTAPAEWHGIPVRAILEANPMTAFIDATRSAVYALEVPSAADAAAMAGWTLAAVALAWLTYRARGRDIAEAV